MNFEEKIIERLKRLEREVERLRVKESPDMSSYSLSTHDHDSDYLGISAKAADSDKLDGLDSTDFGRPVFLANPLTSNSFNNNSFSTTAKTKISLNTLYGVPAGAKAVMVKIRANDSASPSNMWLYAGVGANNVDNNLSVTARPAGLPSYYNSEVSGTCACDANGDIYFQCLASGTDTMTVRIQIWGYWL